MYLVSTAMGEKSSIYYPQGTKHFNFAISKLGRYNAKGTYHRSSFFEVDKDFVPHQLERAEAAAARPRVASPRVAAMGGPARQEHRREEEK